MIRNYYNMLGRFLRFGTQKQQPKQQPKQEKQEKKTIYKQEEKAQRLREEYNKEIYKYIDENKINDDLHLATIKDRRDNLQFKIKYLKDLINNGQTLSELIKDYGPFSYHRQFLKKHMTDDEYMAYYIIPLYLTIKEMKD